MPRTTEDLLNFLIANGKEVELRDGRIHPMTRDGWVIAGIRNLMSEWQVENFNVKIDWQDFKPGPRSYAVRPR